MVMYVLQNKENKMFYSKIKSWVKDINHARLFKGKVSLFLFFRCSYDNKKGILMYDKGNPFLQFRHFTMNEFDIISVKLVTTGIQKQLTEEYKNNQLLKELEK